MSRLVSRLEAGVQGFVFLPVYIIMKPLAEYKKVSWYWRQPPNWNRTFYRTESGFARGLGCKTAAERKEITSAVKW